MAEEPAVALDETFTSPNGTLSFRYPTGWTVILTKNERDRGSVRTTWALNDADAQLVLTLDARSYTAPAGPPPLTTVLPQGPVPGVLDGLGAPATAVVAATPGQSWGSNGSLIYGIAAGTGADTTLFDLRWGNYYQLSFSGSQDLGRPAEEAELAAEAKELATSSRFRTQILPILQSLTASTPPTPDGLEDTESTPAEIPAPTWSAVPDTEATCVGQKYTYRNLQGITCEEAKAIMQVTMDTGEPYGARSHRTADYECYESSYGERLQDPSTSQFLCWALDGAGTRGKVVLEADFR